MSDILLQGTGVETFYGKIQALRGIDRAADLVQ